MLNGNNNADLTSGTEANSTQENWTDNMRNYLVVTILFSLFTYFPLVFPFSLIRLVFYSVIAYAVYTKSKQIDRKVYVLFTVAAAFVDVVPGLSIIPVVPTLLNFLGIYLPLRDNH